MRRLQLVAIALIGVLSWAEPAAAGKRVALVIGNGSYTQLPQLKNPTNDARLISDSLTNAGFETIVLLTDVTLTNFRASLRRFRDLAAGAEVALFYFAGHGMEANGVNFLIPTDAVVMQERDLENAAIPVNLVLEALRGAETRVLVLDACRDNPLTQASHRGLGRMETDNVVILFAAAPGATAMDGGSNSPFALALANRLREPGIAVQDLGLHVRFDVLQATGDQQSPHVSANVAPNKVYLVGPGQVRIDFSPGQKAEPPSYAIVADPYLRNGPVGISIDKREPPDSRIIFVTNAGLYAGRAIEPTASQVFLTQTDTGNIPASFTLRFSVPLSSVSFLVPRAFAATESGITFPKWQAVALDARGQELSSVGEGLTRRFGNVPARAHKLAAPAFDGIAALRFDSDPNLNGRPFAGFSTILIEQLTVEPKR
jgi:caspase domain-containing protein